ncbi:MAG: hypothetical protein ACLQGU_09620 [bacterium]
MSKVIIGLLILVFLVLILLLLCIAVLTLALLIFARKGKEGAKRAAFPVDWKAGLLRET